MIGISKDEARELIALIDALEHPSPMTISLAERLAVLLVADPEGGAS